MYSFIKLWTRLQTAWLITLNKTARKTLMLHYTQGSVAGIITTLYNEEHLSFHLRLYVQSIFLNKLQSFLTTSFRYCKVAIPFKLKTELLPSWQWNSWYKVNQNIKYSGTTHEMVQYFLRKPKRNPQCPPAAWQDISLSVLSIHLWPLLQELLVLLPCYPEASFGLVW